MAKRAAKLFTKLPEGVGRTALIPAIRCTPSEKEQITQNAADCSMGVGEFVRLAALGRQTRSKVDALIINELRLIGNRVKELHDIAPTIDPHRLSTLLEEVIEAIRQTSRRRGGE